MDQYLNKKPKRLESDMIKLGQKIQGDRKIKSNYSPILLPAANIFLLLFIFLIPDPFCSTFGY